MSIITSYLTQSCAIARPRTPDAWGATTADSGITVACRITKRQQQVRLPDGTLSLSSAHLLLGDADIRAGDQVTLPGDDAPYHVLVVDESRDLSATVAIKHVYLA